MLKEITITAKKEDLFNLFKKDRYGHYSCRGICAGESIETNYTYYTSVKRPDVYIDSPLGGCAERKITEYIELPFGNFVVHLFCEEVVVKNRTFYNVDTAHIQAREVV